MSTNNNWVDLTEEKEDDFTTRVPAVECPGRQDEVAPLIEPTFSTETIDENPEVDRYDITF